MTAAEQSVGKPSAAHVAYRSSPRSANDMPPAFKAGSAAAKARNDRARLRAQGLRPMQIWVPDVSAPAFRAEAHRQSHAIAESERDAEDQAFIDAVSDQGDE
ncbi:antitoxin MazE family protein [Methylobacterium phyllosphaerae]